MSNRKKIIYICAARMIFFPFTQKINFRKNSPETTTTNYWYGYLSEFHVNHMHLIIVIIVVCYILV